MLLLELVLLLQLYFVSAGTKAVETEYKNGWYCSKDTYYIVDWYGSYMGNSGTVYADELFHVVDRETPLMDVKTSPNDDFKFKVKKCHTSESIIYDDFYLLNVTKNSKKFPPVHNWYFGKSGKIQSNTVVTNADWNYARMVRQQDPLQYNGVISTLKGRNFYNLIFSVDVDASMFWGNYFPLKDNMITSEGEKKYFTFINVPEMKDDRPMLNVDQENDGGSKTNKSKENKINKETSTELEKSKTQQNQQDQQDQQHTDKSKENKINSTEQTNKINEETLTSSSSAHLVSAALLCLLAN